MALKPTIYKLNIALSDLERDYYDSINLTLAQHPSETIERMVARVMAYCINADEHLKFTKGLSEVEVPDIWNITLDDQIALWIDVGEPDFERVKKSCNKSKAVKVYSFNTKSDVWWNQGQQKFNQLNADFYRFEWDEIEKLASIIQRTMAISVTITGDSAYVTLDSEACEVNWQKL